MGQLADSVIDGDLHVTGMIYGNHAGNYALCSSPANATTKQVTVPGLIVTTGIHVIIKFTNTNTVAPSSVLLQVNSSTAAAIKMNGTNMPSAGTLAANGIYEFVYDGTNWILFGNAGTYVDTDTLVRASVASSGEFPMLMTSSGSPSSGTAMEAAYDADVKIIPLKNAITANITGSASTVDRYNRVSVTSTTIANHRYRMLANCTENLSANTAVSVVLLLHTNETAYSDTGVIKLTYKCGTSANSPGTIECKWIHRSGFIPRTSITAYVSCGPTKTVIGIAYEMPRDQTDMRVLMLDKVGNWFMHESSTTSGSSFNSLDIIKSVIVIASETSSSTVDVEVTASDDSVADCKTSYEVGATSVADINSNNKLTKNILATNTMDDAVLYIGLSQMTRNTTYCFDLFGPSLGAVYLHNDLDTYIFLWLANRSYPYEAGDTFKIVSPQSTTMHGKTSSMKVWVTLMDFYGVGWYLYITYGY